MQKKYLLLITSFIAIIAGVGWIAWPRNNNGSNKEENRQEEQLIVDIDGTKVSPSTIKTSSTPIVKTYGDLILTVYPNKPEELVSFAQTNEPVGWWVVHKESFDWFVPDISEDKQMAVISVTQPGTYAWIIFPQRDPPQPLIATVILGGKVEDLEIKHFTATPETIKKGESSILSWSVSPKMAVVELNNNKVDAQEQKVVSPTETTGYTLVATYQNKQKQANKTVIVKEDNPPPPPPPAEELHVLIVLERDEQGSLPLDQREILMSESEGSVILWLKENCAKDESNMPAYRILDDDYDDGLEHETKSWQEIYIYYKKNHDQKGPWMMAVNGQRKYDDLLPNSKEETLQILKEIKGK